MSKVVIVGASVGGVKAGQALRNEGFDGQLIYVEAEKLERPYDKPPLSKAHLSTDQGVEAIPLLDEDSFRDLRAEWRFGVAASGVEIDTKKLLLEDGSAVSYDTLVIATGARARRSPWGEDANIHVLRTADDATRLRKDLIPGSHLVVIGGGFIGAETASTAKKAGLRVSIVDPLPAPMSRVLNEEVGKIFFDKHASEGIEMFFECGVDSIEGIGRDDMKKSVVLSDGTVLEADAILVGIGAQVNTEWLEGSALHLDNGIVCDKSLRALSTEDIYVLGDVCRYQSAENETTRLEHWTSAAEQALVVAHNIVNPREPKEYIPKEYVWSDQFDWKIQVVGNTGAEKFQLVGEITAGKFAVIYSADGSSVSGAVIVNWPRALVRARQAVYSATSMAELVDSVGVISSAK